MGRTHTQTHPCAHTLSFFLFSLPHPWEREKKPAEDGANGDKYTHVHILPTPQPPLSSPLSPLIHADLQENDVTVVARERVEEGLDLLARPAPRRCTDT